MHDDTPNLVNSIDIIMNIGSVIFMILAGIILLIVKREFFYFLTGLLMLFFLCYWSGKWKCRFKFFIECVWGNINDDILICIF